MLGGQLAHGCEHSVRDLLARLYRPRLLAQLPGVAALGQVDDDGRPARALLQAGVRGDQRLVEAIDRSPHAFPLVAGEQVRELAGAQRAFGAQQLDDLPLQRVELGAARDGDERGDEVERDERRATAEVLPRADETLGRQLVLRPPNEVHRLRPLEELAALVAFRVLVLAARDLPERRQHDVLARKDERESDAVDPRGRVFERPNRHNRIMARILLGVTGGIAAYKAAELTRLLVKARHEVYPLVTRADLLVVAPCTANTLAKLAHGLADNVLTEAALAHRGPVLLAPAMNPRMWAA